AELSDRVREAVRRALPQARVVDSEESADFVIAGRISRGGLGYRASLELRDRSGDIVQRASATAGSRSELAEAIDGAAVDLVRSRQEAGGPITIAPLPAVPAPAGAPEDALNLEADAGVLVAWDRARRIEAQGKERPEDAAAAWRRVAEMRGQNPFREIALTRASQWEAYAAGRRALDAACAAGAANACAESGDRWLQGELRDPARAIGALQRGCDASSAAACVRLARVYEEGEGASPNAKTGLDFREKACAAGDGRSC